MGRYYTNQQGDQGKFWVALQPSDDPESVYGMDNCGEDEYDETYTNYFSDNSEYIKGKLDEQYDILGVPKEERKYELDKFEDRFDYVWKDLSKYFLRKDNPDHVIGYATEDGSAYPISEEKALAASRIDLGLFIYKTIKEYGECMMEAEY